MCEALILKIHPTEALFKFDRNTLMKIQTKSALQLTSSLKSSQTTTLRQNQPASSAGSSRATSTASVSGRGSDRKLALKEDPRSADQIHDSYERMQQAKCNNKHAGMDNLERKGKQWTDYAGGVKKNIDGLIQGGKNNLDTAGKVVQTLFDAATGNSGKKR